MPINPTGPQPVTNTNFAPTSCASIRTDILRQYRMDRVTEIFLKHGDMKWQILRVFPGVLGRDSNVFRKSTITIYADDLRVFADVLASGTAKIAVIADNVTFQRNEITDPDAFHVIRDLDNLASNFMPNDERWIKPMLRPLIPIVDMEIGATD
jgi:hypothetical protein